MRWRNNHCPLFNHLCQAVALEGFAGPVCAGNGWKHPQALGFSSSLVLLLELLISPPALVPPHGLSPDKSAAAPSLMASWMFSVQRTFILKPNLDFCAGEALELWHSLEGSSGVSLGPAWAGKTDLRFLQFAWGHIHWNFGGLQCWRSLWLWTSGVSQRWQWGFAAECLPERTETKLCVESGV